MLQPLLHKLTFFAQTVSCNPNTDNPDSGAFFGFPHWWQYITEGERDALGRCTPVVEIPGGIWAIAFAVIDMLLYLAGIVAVVAIIVAGVSYILSMGNVEKTTAARRRILTALVGLAIVVTASAIVGFIGNQVG